MAPVVSSGLRSSGRSVQLHCHRREPGRDSGTDGESDRSADCNPQKRGFTLCPCDLQGNVVLWKPSDTAVSASYAVYKVLRECGLPPNIIQFLPADGPVFGDAVTASRHLAGINFTGSVP